MVVMTATERANVRQACEDDEGEERREEERREVASSCAMIDR